jgi:hypothetical protein
MILNSLSCKDYQVQLSYETRWLVFATSEVLMAVKIQVEVP